MIAPKYLTDLMCSPFIGILTFTMKRDSEYTIGAPLQLFDMLDTAELGIAELVLRVTDRYQLKIVQVYAPTTSHSDEETDNFYNTIDNILEKQTYYTIVMGDFNAKVGEQTNTSERATGCFGIMTDKPSMVTDVTVINRIIY